MRYFAIVVCAIVLVGCGSSSDSKITGPVPSQSAGAKSPPVVVSSTSKPPPTPTPGPVYKFRVSAITCETDATNTRECKGTVTNISPKQITDAKPVMHWTGGTDSDLGTVDINPILPGQSANFSTFTLNANPQLTAYTIGFKKTFGDESDFPVEPIP